MGLRKKSGAGLVAALVALLLTVRPAAGQPRLSGYYENTLQLDYDRDVATETLIDYSKLRLDISAGGGENEFEFRGNINFIHYHTEAAYDIESYLPDPVVEQLRLAGVSTQIPFETNRIYLDNAWLTWDAGRLRLRLGTQQLSWGPGYSLNPTDLFHRKNLVDPTYEKEGVAALRLDYRWGFGGQGSLIMAPGSTFQASGYALRAATHMSRIGYDVALTGHHVTDSTSVDLATMRPLEQRREALGLELSGPLLGLGFWVEGNYNWMEREDDFLRAVSGVDYTFGSGLYVMVEGLVNMRAEWEPPYPIQDWLSSVFYGEPVGRGWVLGGVTKDLTALSTGSIYLFAAYDGSVMVNPRLSWSVAQNAEAELFGAVTAGRGEGSFPPGLYSAYTRLTVYF